MSFVQAAPHRGVRTRLQSFLFAPIDIAPLVYFRIAFGAIMMWEVGRYFSYGWIDMYYIDPDFLFSFYGFDWVKPWPGIGMYLHFAGMGTLALCIMIGLWYRTAMVLFFAAFSYVFLLAPTHYLNHFYLIILISFCLILVPAHRAGSLDTQRQPHRRLAVAPAWTLWLLRFQIGVAYFFGGIAKLNADWLAGEPMRMWLLDRTDMAVVGPLFVHEPVIYAMSYGGLLLDLFIVPLLLWRRTRLYAVALAVFFHVSNMFLFSIGIFPWMMIATIPLFFPPEQVGIVLRRIGLLGKQVADRLPEPRRPRLILALLGLYVMWQVLFPLRHWLYPGNVSWTEEGHNFSWHMKLRDKSAQIDFRATDPVSGATWNVNPRRYLTSRQVRKMSTRPDLIHDFSHHLSRELTSPGNPPIEIRVVSSVSLNGRPPQLMIDPTVDLAAEPRNLRHKSWILPLK